MHFWCISDFSKIGGISDISDGISDAFRIFFTGFKKNKTIKMN